MFAKKPHVDVKKSIQKILDNKKDTFSRLKHLKQCLELSEFEAKTFFETNYSQIYFIFFDTISNLDTTFKQKGQKQSKEEQDVCLFIFEKILIYLPEMLNKGWQQHSIGFLLQRLLHHQNSIAIRCEGVRLFLIWYQILNINAKQNVHHMFASLVPGIVPEIPNPFLHNTTNSQLQLNALSTTKPIIPSSDLHHSNPHHHLEAHQQRLKQYNLNETTTQSIPNQHLINPQVFNNLNYNNVPGNLYVSNNPVIAAEIEPMLPSFILESPPKDYTIFYLQHLLNYMVNQVNKIQWTENRKHKHRQGFRFLFEQFNLIYLRNIFIELDDKFSFYEPKLILPSSRIISLDEKPNFNNKRFQYANTLLDCKARVIMWFAKFMKSNQIELVKKEKINDRTNGNFLKHGPNEQFNQNDFSMINKQNNFNLNCQLVDPTPVELDIVFSLLTSTRANINLVHQILNQAFLMPFWQAETMREVVGVYREWIYKNYNQVPIFLCEPKSNEMNNQSKQIEEDVCAGLSSFHRIFITYSANVFLVSGVPAKRSFLDEQVEMCKRVLNVYRYMVMKVEMDKETWEQLLLVVLRITSIVLTEKLPIKKEDTLGGRLAPAFFETLIVTWIKANLNIFVNMDLWERFQKTLQSLTAWEELIKEWSRTIDTLTRVMSRYVYNINLLDLPLDRPINRKNKRQVSRGKTVGQVNFNPKINQLNENSIKIISTTNESGQTTNDNSMTNDDSTSNFNKQHSIESNDSKNDRFNQSIKSNRSTQSNQINHSKQSNDEKRSIESDKNFHKSSSDSNLLRLGREQSMKMIKSKANEEFKSYMENFIGFERDCDNEIQKPTDYNHQFKFNQNHLQNLKSKSLINISTFNIISNQHDLESEVQSLNQSRSPSPILCTNLETNLSLKESPLNFDGLSTATNQESTNHQYHQNNQQQQQRINNQQQQSDVQNRSVITGGSYKNWSPDSAVILWRRMLAVLGDINGFKNPHLHTLAIQCLAKIVDDFIKIRDNLGIIIDQTGNIQQNLDFFPSHVPPLDYFISWLFEATSLSDDYKQGKLIAYKLLCEIAIRKHESLMESNNEFLPMLYHTLHNGLNSCDLELISVIIRTCEAKLFSLSLPGSSSLLYDFTEAAKLILNSNEIKDVPRYESLILLSTLIGMNEIYQQVNALSPSDYNPTLVMNGNHTNFILELLIKAAKKEQTALGRSIALNALGVYLYQQLSLSNENLDAHLLTIINVLIGCTKFPNRILSRYACDLIRLQCDYSEFILKRYPKIIAIIIEGLISSIRYHIEIAEKQNTFKEYQNLLLSLLICLSEWCLVIPKDQLKRIQSTSLQTESILYAVLKLLNDLSNYNVNSGMNSSFFNQNQNSFMFKKCFEDSEIDYTIEIDNLVDNSITRRINKFDSQRPNLELNSSIGNARSTTNQLNGNNINNKQPAVDDLAIIWMAASMLTNHLLSFVGNFPLPQLGSSRLSCYVNEYDDNPYLIKKVDQTDLEIDLFNAPNIIFFIVNNSSIISFVDLTDNQQSSSNDGTPTSMNNQKENLLSEKNKSKLRVILRDLTGKFSWTCTNLHSINKRSLVNLKNVEKNFETNLSHSNDDDDLNQTDEQRPDPLELLLQNLNEISPECSINNNSQHNSLSNQKRSSSFISQKINNSQIEQTEENMMALLVNQHYQEMNYAEKLSESQSTLNLNKQNALNYQEKIDKCFEINKIPTEFLNCRQFIDQIGFLNWEKRTKIELLAKNERVLRELRNLDKQKCRETHKIAVIYVKEGQEDKHSILSNQCGSKEFEQFVTGLGWEVDLSKHLGFRGGLEDNLSTGKSAPYYANSFYEVIFHVSTRIPSTSTDENGQSNTDYLNKKLRHLGNDEVHIVWSEHYRNYRRGIIPTEFCDILIEIYPVIAYPGYYRVKISDKRSRSFFAPLWDESVVHLSILSGLVRATAINASRTHRMKVPLYKHFFEERNQCLQNIFKQHKELTSFETFASTVYSPKQQEITGNGFFSNSILHQQSIVDNNPLNNQSNEQNNSTKNSNSKLLNQQQTQEIRKSFDQPIIRNEHLERPNIKLMHQNSEPMLRTNQQRSASVYLKNNNHHDILHLKPMGN